MITLKSQSGSQLIGIRKATKTITGHPLLTGTSYVNYTLTHDLGAPVNLVIVKQTTGVDFPLQTPEHHYPPSTSHERGWRMSIPHSETQATIRLYRAAADFEVDLYHVD